MDNITSERLESLGPTLVEPGAFQHDVGGCLRSLVAESARWFRQFVEDCFVPSAVVMPGDGLNDRADAGLTEFANAVAFVQIDFWEEDSGLPSILPRFPSVVPDVSCVLVHSLVDIGPGNGDKGTRAKWGVRSPHFGQFVRSFISRNANVCLDPAKGDSFGAAYPV